MKKILYLAAAFAITLTGCAPLMRPIYDGPTTNYNPPTNYDPPQSNVPPPPDYNSTQYNNQQANYNGNNPDYDNSPQTDQVFYDELSPYGTWIDYPDYGYVWVPGDVGSDFVPYATNGYWVYSDYGWTWASNYAWGWAPFHYGNWFYDDSYGWMWVPGNEWAPAWVAWGSYGDYYCWAPLAPRTNINTIGTRDGWTPSAGTWNVVQRSHMAQPDVYNYIIRINATVINNVVHHVKIINNVAKNYNNRGTGGTATYNRGPQINEVENAANTRIQTIKVGDNVKPGAQSLHNNQLLVYRPVIKQNTQQVGLTVAPRKVGTYQPKNGRTPQQQPIRSDGNPNQQQNPNQRPNQQQQVRPEVTPNPQQNPNQRPNQQQQVRPEVNQNPQQNPNQRPNQQQQVRPEVNQNPNQRPNQQQQVRPEVNQNPQQNPNQRPNQQQPVRPEVNQNPQQNPNQRPNQQPQPNPNQRPGNQLPQQNNKGQIIKNKDAENAKRRADSIIKAREKM